MSEDIVPFPPLPVELVRNMIERAALIDVPTALALAQVSRVVNAWTTPIIYHTVILDTEERVIAFNRCLELIQSTTVQNTRHISYLTIYRISMYHYERSLSYCPNVQHLLLRPRLKEVVSVETSVSLWPRPWHIVLLGDPLTFLTERFDLFAHTTHLYLSKGFYRWIVDLCVTLPLTHVCIALWEDHDELSVVQPCVEDLLTMPSMRMVLIHALVSGSPIDDFFGGVWEELADIADDRLIVAPGMVDDDLLELFGVEETVWDTAEEYKDWRQRVKVE